jgi:hypothetical protein
MLSFSRYSHVDQGHGISARRETGVRPARTWLVVQTLSLAAMILGILSLPALAGGLTPLEANVKDLVEALYPKYTLHREESLSEAIRQWAVYKEWIGGNHPGITCGKFRNDGEIDCAVLLETKGDPFHAVASLYYVMNATSEKRFVIPLENYEWREYNSEAFISYAQQGEYFDYNKFETKRMARDGFLVTFGEREGYGYYWDNGALVKVITSY